MVIFLADQTMSAQSLCRAQADLADYKRPIKTPTRRSDFTQNDEQKKNTIFDML